MTNDTVLKVICMYCGRRMPDRPGYGVTGISAGFCEVCWAEHYPGVPYPTEEEARALDASVGTQMLRTETERKSVHERIFGKGSTPPLERLGRGKLANDLMPMPPEQGPPLPRKLGLKWPWRSERVKGVCR